MSSADPPRKPEALASSATVAMVCDALDTVGHRAQALDVALQPLVRPARLVGRARTVEFIAGHTDAADDDPYGDMINFIEALSAGDVAVIAAHGSMRSGYWGELFVPRLIEATVIDAANARASGESTVLAALTDGTSLRQAWERHRLL